MKKNKKLIKLESELKVYNKIAMKVARVLDAKLNIEDLDDYIFSKIRKIDEDILNLVLEESNNQVEDGPRFGPGDFVDYEGLRYEILEVHHKDKTYKVKFNLSGKIKFIDWTSYLKKWK